MKLVEKRIGYYPSLYPVLSKFIKDCNVVLPFRVEPITRSELLTLLKEINECDARISLFFRSDTAKCMFELQKCILIHLAKNEIEYTTENLKDVGERARNLEENLRSDIGIYGLELSREPQLRSGRWGINH
jgi:hypothetical protein